MIRPGVARMVMTFSEDGFAATTSEGDMVVEVDDVPHTPADRLIWYTLDLGRLRDLLAQAGLDDEAISGLVFELDAAAAMSTVSNPDDDEDDDISYWRPELIKTLVNHQQVTPPRGRSIACLCGWGTRPEDLGKSYADHVADEYEKEARG